MHCPRHWMRLGDTVPLLVEVIFIYAQSYKFIRHEI